MDENMTNGMSSGGMMAMMSGLWIFYLALYVFISYCLYRIFQKAGKENAWAAFIPIYNYVVLLEVIGKPIWWLFMFIIPCVNIYFAIVTYIELGKRFGKDTGWSIIFLLICGIIGLPMLAFGDAQYTPPSSDSSAT